MGFSNRSALEAEEVVRDGLATCQEAQTFLRCGRAKLYELMASGQLKWAKVGGSRRIPWAALRAFAASCLQGV